MWPFLVSSRRDGVGVYWDQEDDQEEDQGDILGDEFDSNVVEMERKEGESVVSTNQSTDDAGTTSHSEAESESKSESKLVLPPIKISK